MPHRINSQGRSPLSLKPGPGGPVAFEESVEAAQVVRSGSTRDLAAMRTRLDTTTAAEAWNAGHALPPEALATRLVPSVPARGEPSRLPCSRGDRPLAPEEAGACHGDVRVLSLRAVSLAP